MAIRYGREEVLDLNKVLKEEQEQKAKQEAAQSAGDSVPVTDGFPYPPGTIFVTKFIPEHFGRPVSITVGLYNKDEGTVGFNGVVPPTAGLPSRIERSCPYCNHEFEERAELVYPEVLPGDYVTWQDRWGATDFLDWLKKMRAEKVE